MNPLIWFAAISKMFSDPDLREAAAALWRWYERLTEDERVAYAQRFEPTGGFGVSLAANCPTPPPEAEAADKAMLEAMA